MQFKSLLSAFLLLGVFAELKAINFSREKSFNDKIPQPFSQQYVRSTDPAPLIEGGILVEGREFPWVASLHAGANHICSVNILNSEWVLGVATCMLESASAYSVEVGTNKLDTGGVFHKVKEIVIHEDYNETNSWVNDIALLKVYPPIEMGNGVSSAVLPEQDKVTPTETAGQIAGWGTLEYFGYPVNDLHKLTVYVFDHKKCEEVYASLPKHIYSTQICAASKENEEGPTYGDSADPITVNGTIIGLASWNGSINKLGFPAIYTEVSHYVDWIKEHINM